MDEHERGDNAEEHTDAATEAARPDVEEEQAVDPSINVGRDSFGNVSDFGVQPNAPDTHTQEQ